MPVSPSSGKLTFFIRAAPLITLYLDIFKVCLFHTGNLSLPTSPFHVIHTFTFIQIHYYQISTCIDSPVIQNSWRNHLSFKQSFILHFHQCFSFPCRYSNIFLILPGICIIYFQNLSFRLCSSHYSTIPGAWK